MVLACQECYAKMKWDSIIYWSIVGVVLIIGIPLFYMFRDGLPTKRNAWKRKILRSLRRDGLSVLNGTDVRLGLFHPGHNVPDACRYCGKPTGGEPMLIYAYTAGDYDRYYTAVCPDRPACRVRHDSNVKQAKEVEAKHDSERAARFDESVVL